MADYPKVTVVYKTVGQLDVHLDLYLPEDPPTTSKTPILIFFHGGGLLQGSRTEVRPHCFSVLQNGYALVSADYRLAPQVPARDIITDVVDCLTFVRDDLQHHVPQSSGIVLDPTRIAVSGVSAGGYLTFMAGLRSDIPQVLLPIYPMTDPCGEFFHKPQLGGADRPIIDRSVVAPFLDKNAAPTSGSPQSSSRQNMYLFMLQDPHLDELWDVRAGDEDTVIRLAIKKKGSLAPTYIVHPDADTKVGIEQSEEVAEVLSEIGADFRFERIPGLDHLFDRDAKYRLEEMYEFMYTHLK
ncbi:alpha/beta-hydrolase [Thozetella sp. PMI_491]|nr:alpha/beta-hydrolase [Thozetella sp. PMI_491]